MIVGLCTTRNGFPWTAARFRLLFMLYAKMSGFVLFVSHGLIAARPRTFPSFYLGPCLLLDSLNEEGKCLKHVPSRSSSPADSRTVFTLPRAEQTRFEAARAQANTSSRVFQRHASRADLRHSDPARHAFSTEHYMIALFSRSLRHKDEKTGTPTASSNDIHNTNRPR